MAWLMNGLEYINSIFRQNILNYEILRVKKKCFIIYVLKYVNIKIISSYIKYIN